MPTPTKQRILSSAIRLFNEHGMDAVRLQQIAEESGMSVGNLAYHFRNKDAITEALSEQLFEEFSGLFRQYLPAAELVGFQQQLSRYYHFFQAYPFLLADFLRNTDAPQQQRWQQGLKRLVLQLQSWLQLQQQRLVIDRALSAAQLKTLAQALWLTLVFHPLSCSLQNIACEETTYCQLFWQQVQPYFTAAGQTEFYLLNQFS